jgi:hypothetical protein
MKKGKSGQLVKLFSFQATLTLLNASKAKMIQPILVFADNQGII